MTFSLKVTMITLNLRKRRACYFYACNEKAKRHLVSEAKNKEKARDSYRGAVVSINPFLLAIENNGVQCAGVKHPQGCDGHKRGKTDTPTARGLPRGITVFSTVTQNEEQTSPVTGWQKKQKRDPDAEDVKMDFSVLILKRNLICFHMCLHVTKPVN